MRRKGVGHKVPREEGSHWCPAPAGRPSGRKMGRKDRASAAPMPPG